MLKKLNLKDDLSLIEALIDRNQFEFTDVNDDVLTILKTVKDKGDQALHDYSIQFDGVDVRDFKVTKDEIDEAFASIDRQLLTDIKIALGNIQTYHHKQGFKNFELKQDHGVRLGQRVKPIESVGIYVPGGTASYPSTVLMNAVPAKIAGVKNLVMVTPPLKDGSIKASILVAASLAGVDAIYKIGGAHSIAALAFGTKTVPKVDKIVGPGNIYVSMAKKFISGYVGIDMIAGPSEILILADESADPDNVAADLMGQAEHDVLASSILITTSTALADRVIKSLSAQLPNMERQNIIQQALQDYGGIILTETLEEAITLSNRIAPEHLEIITSNPFDVLDKIENAGSIFLGAYTPEPVGDYLAGPNHTLPTSGTARFASPLSTADFQKKSSYLYYTKAALQNFGPSIIRFANEEGLTAHANAIKMRIDKEE